MQAVIFDLDGTLVDSAAGIHACVNATLADNGYPALTLAQVQSFVGGGAPLLITRVMAATGLGDDAAFHADMLARFMARYEDRPERLTRPYAGVEGALDTLAERGLKLGLCTNKPFGATQALLAGLGWGGRFDVVIGGDSLPTRKPDPAPLHAAIAGLGAERIAYVGDSEVDAETAARAGVDFVIYSQGYRKTPIDQLPHRAVFDHWDDLPALLATL